MNSGAPSVKVTSADALVRRMQDDWNDRAREDARFYIACGQRNEGEEAFARHAQDVVQRIRRDLAWLPPGQAERSFRFLEIGCGIGRLMAHLAHDCGEIHGVDISDEMVAQGRARLAGLPHATLHHAPNSDLGAFADDSLDLVYSYAVLQHVPHVDFVWRYLEEAARVLRPGGILTAQVNTLPIEREQYDTWSGAIVPADLLADRCRSYGFRLRALEGRETQYTWISAQKTSATWRPMPRAALIDHVRASDGTADLLPARDAVQATIRFLPTEACDVTELDLRANGHRLPVSRVGVAGPGREREIEALVPGDVVPGRADLTLYWRGTPVSAPRGVVLADPLGAGPRILRITDGQELSRENVSSCGWVKLWLRDWFGDESSFAAKLGNEPLYFNLHCDDRRLGAWQVNVRLPEALRPGQVELHVFLAAPPVEPVAIPIMVEAAPPR